LSSFVSLNDFTKLEKFTKKVLEKANIKSQIYKILIIPNQNIAIKKLEKLVNKTPDLKNPKIKKGRKKIIFIH
jgi:hypothetical protein